MQRKKICSPGKTSRSQLRGPQWEAGYFCSDKGLATHRHNTPRERRT